MRQEQTLNDVPERRPRLVAKLRADVSAETKRIDDDNDRVARKTHHIPVSHAAEDKVAPVTMPDMSAVNDEVKSKGDLHCGLPLRRR